MTQNMSLIIPPSHLRQFFLLIGGSVGMLVGILLIVGFGIIWMVCAAIIVLLGVILFLVGFISGRPRLILMPEGFECQALTGGRKRCWKDVDGLFTVVQVGAIKVVGYNLTAECKARPGELCTRPVAGYDEATSGTFQKSAHEVAELLNSWKQKHTEK